jgi:hypothetical protein
LRRDPSPATLKGSRTFDLAAGGCPALPSCEGQGRVVPGPPTVWVAGLTADLYRNWEVEVGQMRGTSVWRSFEPLPPAGCLGSRGPKEYPVWGASGSPGT